VGKKILVAYTTNAGSTSEVAGAIAKTLGKSGAQIDLRRIKEVADVRPYNAVIVGGPMMMGWHKEAVNFLGKHQQVLSRIPVACFLTALRLTKTSETSLDNVSVYLDPALAKPPTEKNKLSFMEKHATVEHYLSPVLRKASLVKPVSVGFFAGKLDYSKLNILHRLFVKLVIRAQTGDFRNWEAIRQWAASLNL
jgi:menaquinone-dependent protoporphyrinogen oxidase